MPSGSVVDRTGLFQDIDEDLKSTIAFLYEASRLKGVIRQTYLPDQDRYENSAEHSWNLILMALALHKTANEPVNLERVLSMLALHDLGEIGSGDIDFFSASRAQACESEKMFILQLFANVNPIQNKDFWIYGTNLSEAIHRTQNLREPWIGFSLF